MKKVRNDGECEAGLTDLLIICALIGLFAMVCLTGCNTGLVSSSVKTTTTTIATNGTPISVTQKNDVLAMRGTVLVNTEVDKANIEWGNVKINVGGLTTAGDAKSITALGTAISKGIVAWFTYGTEAAVTGAVIATLKSSATNCVEGVCAPTAPVCAPGTPNCNL